MAKPMTIALGRGPDIEILYEDRAALAIDKPAGWMLAPDAWERTGRNLQLALMSSLRAGDYWAASRRLRFLRYVHRLDSETTGVLLLAKSRGALTALSELFQTREARKSYLAVVCGCPKMEEWRCTLGLAADPQQTGRMVADDRHGQPAETFFRVIQRAATHSLVEARPITGRTHQIRVHLAESGHPVVSDRLYGRSRDVGRSHSALFGLRAISLSYTDPFQRRPVHIRAPWEGFVRAFGFDPGFPRVEEGVRPGGKPLGGREKSF